VRFWRFGAAEPEAERDLLEGDEEAGTGGGARAGSRAAAGSCLFHRGLLWTLHAEEDDQEQGTGQGEGEGEGDGGGRAGAPAASQSQLVTPRPLGPASMYAQTVAMGPCSPSSQLESAALSGGGGIRSLSVRAVRGGDLTETSGVATMSGGSARSVEIDVATGHRSGQVCVWDARWMQRRAQVQAHDSAVLALAFSPATGAALATGG